VILGPNGLPARHAIVPLASAAIRALVDGRAFAGELEGGGVLRVVGLEPYCLHCDRAGSDSRIRAVLFDDRADWRCGHRAGWISRVKPSEVEPLLKELGWNLRCSSCRENVVGDNSRGAASFRVSCGCTTREKANPLALAGVGRA